MELIGWVVLYDDGMERSSHDTKWEELPADGVLAVIEFYDNGKRVVHHSRDYYVLDNGKAYGTNNIHPYLHKLGTIKFGRWSKDSFFHTVLKKADKYVFDFRSNNQKGSGENALGDETSRP